MEQMLYLRETLSSFYKRYETIFIYAFKFIVGLIIFNLINSIGYPSDSISKVAGFAFSFIYVFLMAALFVVMPLSLSYFLMILNISIQLSSNLFVCIFVTMALLCILCLYARLAPKESVLILAVVLAYYFKLPYVVPFTVGLYCGFTAIIPVTIGVCIWNFTPVINSMMRTSSVSVGMEDILGSVTKSVPIIMSSFAGNQEWVLAAFIFVMVILVVHIISRLSIDFSREIAILLGAVLNIISFVIAVIVTRASFNILGVIISTLFSAILTLAIAYFDKVLDYQRVERVQFEDDENYYYVKVVPKAVLIRRNRKVRRIRPSYDESADYDDYIEE